MYVRQDCDYESEADHTKRGFVRLPGITLLLPICLRKSSQSSTSEPLNTTMRRVAVYVPPWPRLMKREALRSWMCQIVVPRLLIHHRGNKVLQETLA